MGEKYQRHGALKQACVAAEPASLPHRLCLPLMYRAVLSFLLRSLPQPWKKWCWHPALWQSRITESDLLRKSQLAGHPWQRGPTFSWGVQQGGHHQPRPRYTSWEVSETRCLRFAQLEALGKGLGAAETNWPHLEAEAPPGRWREERRQEVADLLVLRKQQAWERDTVPWKPKLWCFSVCAPGTSCITLTWHVEKWDSWATNITNPNFWEREEESAC